MKIVTLTLNPALDISTNVDEVAPFAKLRCGTFRRDPGGGGVNVARVVRRLGAEAVAVFPVGGPSGEVLARLVRAEGVEVKMIPIAGETREDFSIFERRSNKQFRFVAEGPLLSEGEWRRCLDTFVEAARGSDYAVVSGSAPPGVPKEVFSELAVKLRSMGEKLALDTTGGGLGAAVRGGATLIKPNQNEFAELTGVRSMDVEVLARAALAIVSKGVGAVALTLAERGAVIVTDQGAWHAHAPGVVAVSTVGAGDSFLGALVWSRALGRSWPDALRIGVAAGTASLLAPGTDLAHSTEIERLSKVITVSEVAIEGVPHRMRVI